MIRHRDVYIDYVSDRNRNEGLLTCEDRCPLERGLVEGRIRASLRSWSRKDIRGIVYHSTVCAKVS